MLPCPLPLLLRCTATADPALLPPRRRGPQVDLPVFYGNKMRRKMKAGAGCEDLRVRCPHYYRVATALHAAMVATLTADEDFPAFILNTFRNRYKVWVGGWGGGGAGRGGAGQGQAKAGPAARVPGVCAGRLQGWAVLSVRARRVRVVVPPCCPPGISR